MSDKNLPLLSSIKLANTATALLGLAGFMVTILLFGNLDEAQFSSSAMPFIMLTLYIAATLWLTFSSDAVYTANDTNKAKRHAYFLKKAADIGVVLMVIYTLFIVAAMFKAGSFPPLTPTLTENAIKTVALITTALMSITLTSAASNIVQLQANDDSNSAAQAPSSSPS